jgi:hypothetical protein
MSSIISNKQLMFHNKIMPIELFENPTDIFGTLTIKLAKTNKTKKPLFIKSTIDVSGSMDEDSDKNGTRLDYVKRTIIKMLKFLVKTVETDVWIQVDSFSNTFNTVIQKVLLTTSNIDNIINDINNVTSDSMTNIGLAITESNKIIESVMKEHPEYKVIHLFLTDGDPTAGEKNTNKLANMVNSEHTNVFIGYGMQHNAKLLKAFSNKGINNKYMLVDNFENTGLVYGEIIHSLLYSVLENGMITMSDGSLIYDAKTNCWKESIEIPSLISEKENIYHIKSINPANPITCSLSGNIVNTDNNNTSDKIHCIIKQDKLEEKGELEGELEGEVDNDLSKYIFRQIIMELLHKAANIGIEDNISSLKREMKTVFEKMKMYMNTNNLEEDIFMKILCEDIHISYSTLGSREGSMLSQSRNTSQIDQSCHRSGSEYVRGRNIITRIIHLSDDENSDYDSNSDVYSNSDNDSISTVMNKYDIGNYNNQFITDDIYSTQDTMATIHNMNKN